jgi:glycosyltransferase involved in cell wall biosynthesis
MSVCASFVIPALNEARYIGATLGSIRRAMESVAESADYEIIVVDDGSADATVQIARNHGVRAIEVRKRNIAAVRNAGAAAAKGEFLVFVDDAREPEYIRHKTS